MRKFRRGVTNQLLCLLILIALALHADAHAEWDIADSLVPHKLVQAGIYADISGLHLLGDEGLDGLDSARSTLLEATATIQCNESHLNAR